MDKLTCRASLFTLRVAARSHCLALAQKGMGSLEKACIEGSLSREGRGRQTAEMKESRAHKSLPMSLVVVILCALPTFARCCYLKNTRSLSKETKRECTQNTHTQTCGTSSSSAGIAYLA